MRNCRTNNVALAALAALLLAVPAAVFASATDGTIDATFKYAWGERTGWLNLGTTGGNVHVTDAGLTGYAWSENFGWINLNPSQAGVTNNGEGTLGGYAWGGTLGYISFAGATIDTNGQFGGTAAGNAVSGQISFTCSSCVVKTDWRPASVRGGGSSTGSGQGGGGGGGGGGFPPPSGLAVVINNGDALTQSAAVTLTLRADPSPAEITHMRIANFPDFRDSVIEPYARAKPWDLCTGRDVCGPGFYAVYVQFYTSLGAPHAQAYGVFSDNIFYDAGSAALPPGSAKAHAGEPAPPPSGGLGGLIDRFLGGLFGKRPEGEPVLPEFFVPREAPLALRGLWQLIPAPPVLEYVFAPLPQDLALFAEKFPRFGRTLEAVGVSRKADVTKLRSVALSLPNLTESVLPPPAIGEERMTLPPGVPLENIPAELRENIPSGVVFARAAGGSVDLDVLLTLGAGGEVTKRVSAVAGSIVKLIVRPDAPARRVFGYMTFASRSREAEARREHPGVSPQAMLGAVVFSAPTIRALSLDGPWSWLASAADAWNVLIGDAKRAVEERFSVREFEYADPDRDGIYTTTIQSPVVDGEYAIYTVVDYEDPARPAGEIKITALIDPEGYVYERAGGKETRIPGAVVSLEWLNPETKQYELWPAKEFNQENPQVTDVRGTYAFLVPPGWYSLGVSAPGYGAYEGKAFEIQAGGSGIHANIELKNRWGWFGAIEWKDLLLAALAFLVALNFWHDRRRGGVPPQGISSSLPPLPPLSPIPPSPRRSPDSARGDEDGPLP